MNCLKVHILGYRTSYFLFEKCPHHCKILAILHTLLYTEYKAQAENLIFPHILVTIMVIKIYKKDKPQIKILQIV